MQQNGKCRIYGDRDETINHTISECCKFGHKKYIRLDTLIGQSDPLGVVQEIEIWPYEQIFPLSGKIIS